MSASAEAASGLSHERCVWPVARGSNFQTELEHALRTRRLQMDCHKVDAAQQAAWRAADERPPCPQWHLLGLAIWSKWGDLLEEFGLYTICYNRFVRWRRAGVRSRIIDALAAAHDAAVQTIDTSIMRVDQHGACIARNQRQSMGRSRGGLTSKIHAVVDSNGLPVRLALSPVKPTTFDPPEGCCLV